MVAIDRVLVDNGLHETEARFYLAALELGQASMRDVARKAGITRTNAYDVFARLVERRLVAEVPGTSARSMLIVAESPDRVVEIIDERRRKLDQALPELRSMHNRAASKPKVRYYQGEDGIKAVLEQTLKCRSKNLSGILSMRDLYEIPGRRWMDELVRRRIAAHVALRVIRSRAHDLHGLWPESDQDLRTLRYAPADFTFPMTTYIYDETVALISSRAENFAMTIESSEYAAMQGALFETLWAASIRPQEVQRRPRGKVIELRGKA